MNDSGLFLWCKSTIYVVDVSVSAVAIVHVILILSRYEITGGRLVAKSSHSINLIIKDG
jgi:hypothetical protein